MTDWDDDRLAAAFRARALASPMPHGLANAAIEAVRRSPVSGRRGSRLAWLSGLAAAAAVAIVAVVLATRPAVGPADDGPTAFGLPIVSVARAAAIRDGGANEQELAVAGFYTSGGPVPCPMPIARDNNLTHVTCPATLNWFMEQPEKLLTVTGESTIWQPPKGPAIQPGLALVDANGLSVRPGDVVPAVMIGHFDDRRANLCADDSRSACADTFLVDRIQQVGNAIIPTNTFAERDPILDEPTVDAAVQAVDPRLEILSRRVVDSDHLVDSEPLLATARFSHFTAFEEPLVWVVVAISPSTDGSPVQARTFVVPDGLNPALIAEITATDVVRIAITASEDPSPTPTAEPTPTSLQGAPRAVLGLGVNSVGSALDLHPNFDDAELAIKGWYVSPDPATDCPGLHDAIRPVRQPVCPEGRHWLLEEPEDLWSDPAKPGIDRLPAGRYINPIIPSDVIFDVPDPWSDGIASPVPVVVVGHFADPRVANSFAGNQSFVVDQLMWAAGQDKPQYAVRLVDDMVESGADVMARVDRAFGRGSGGWISLVHGSDLAVLDERAANTAPELTEAAVVWVVRRLVTEVVDDVPRTVVRFAYTADRSDRVWHGAGCCALDLSTTIDVDLPAIGAGRGIVRIYDYDRLIVAARVGDADAFSGWRPVNPGGWIEIAPGDTQRELAIRWAGDWCDTTWALSIRTGPWLDLTKAFVDGCDALRDVPRVVVLTFDRPIDINTVTANDNTSGG